MTQELIERLEEAEAGSGQLDDLVLKATGHIWHMDFGSSWYSMDGGKTRLYVNSAKVTTSLDAAIALAERVLPGVMWGFQENRIDPAYPTVRPFSAWTRTEDGEIEGEAHSFALALCIAILRAGSDSRKHIVAEGEG
ncbi:hypothetical protein [Brevundimonas sp. FT23028]|uniref:hypothetical protein n=1 Tax=Brevundimonas sp. FT23028 TaxID=3393748 RepID=UPI003B588515